ncbi:hypothetical protein PV04_09518 [Phialophora macrospora]|uniref:Uncharacterized protein n=1 Tax=Phialophora macrospora TaxID=1851006 RepID=A0A0D2FCN0_9EURO|nr:hypothetical protein PV04_09518 [Phialophora macrospora]
MLDLLASIEEGDGKMNPSRKEATEECGWDIEPANWMTQTLLEFIKHQLGVRLCASYLIGPRDKYFERRREVNEEEAGKGKKRHILLLVLYGLD